MTALHHPPMASFPPAHYTNLAHSVNLPPTSPHLLQPHRLPDTPSYGHGHRGDDHRPGSIGHMGAHGTRRGSAGLGLTGTPGLEVMQAQGRPLHSIPAPFPFNPNLTPSVPPLPPVPTAGPRPHPHLINTNLYISNVPHDLPEAAIADALRDCWPVKVTLQAPVNPQDRLKPDVYYDWMPRAGTLHFQTLHNAEKALAILVQHPYLAQAGLTVSTPPPPSSPHDLPHHLPLPDPPVPARYLRPTQQIIPPSAAIDIKDAAAALSAQVPALGELFDIIRPWGSLREITVWFEEGPPTELGPPALSWGARVVFWYEDEARRFEYGFGATGLLIKGWRIFIFPEQLFPPTPPYALDSTHQAHPGTVPRLLPSLPPPPIHLGDTHNVDPEIFRRMSMPIFPTPNFGPGPHHLAPPTPLTPSNTFKPLPWANHNIFADPTKPPFDRRMSVPTTGPNAVPIGGLRRSMSNMKLAQTAVGHSRQRTWSITLSSSMEGEVIPSGIVADDGTIIHHGPGQSLRPAPQSGPGSESTSGLVDYSNVFVKNLDPNINSLFLSDLFSNIGTIVSAKVMRDDEGRSRGYGFVSFYSPHEAAHAIVVMNNTRVGSQNISVNLHQPRKLRPEKQAERQAIQSGMAPLAPKGPISPTRSMRRDRHFSAPVHLSSSTAAPTDLYSLSPEARRVALVKRVTGPVLRYARINHVPLAHTEPAIQALVAHDLALIPVLEDPRLLDSKIAETLSIIQADPETTVNLAVPPPAPHHPQDTPAVPIELSEANLRLKLVAEVKRIDPLDAKAIVDILWTQLQPADRVRATSHRGFLAMRYGLAKRQLVRRLEADRPPTAKSTDSSATSSDPSPPPSLATSTSTAPSAHPPLPPQIDYIRMDDLTLDKLAARSAVDIMAHLSSPVGNEILEKLGMCRPTSDEAGQLARWIMGVRERPGVQRDAEIGAMVAKHFQAGWGKKFAQLKVAREIVEMEDKGALCKLIAYPKLLNAKARLCYEKMNA